MKCKSCGKTITTVQTGIAGVVATPNCICGKIRQRERIKGCPRCNAHGVEIQVKKRIIGHRLTCTCGHKWMVFR